MVSLSLFVLVWLAAAMTSLSIVELCKAFLGAYPMKLQLVGRFMLLFACAPLLPLILLRRLVRCLRKMPSSCCRGPKEIQRPLEPTMRGLHQRFVELYGKKNEKKHVSFEGSTDGLPLKAMPESAVLDMQQRLTLQDGQEIAYWDVGPKDAKEVVLLCQGLGARIAGWVPLFDALCSDGTMSKVTWRERRLVIPEYRGQFASVPLVGGVVSVEQGARDTAEVASALGITSAMLLCWSTGVQIGLQLALDQPGLVKSMVLIQGFNGNMCSCLGQPVFSLPGMPSILLHALAILPTIMRGNLRRTVYNFVANNTVMLEKILSCFVWSFGSDFMAPIGVRYLQDMLQSDAHFANYCGYATALDRHNVCARLDDIKVPALVVTGTPDFVTPARCSYDIASRLGGKKALVDDFGASHYFILEEPHVLAGLIMAFANM